MSDRGCWKVRAIGERKADWMTFHIDSTGSHPFPENPYDLLDKLRALISVVKGSQLITRIRIADFLHTSYVYSLGPRVCTTSADFRWAVLNRIAPDSAWWNYRVLVR